MKAISPVIFGLVTSLSVLPAHAGKGKTTVAVFSGVVAQVKLAKVLDEKLMLAFQRLEKVPEGYVHPQFAKYYRKTEETLLPRMDYVVPYQDNVFAVSRENAKETVRVYNRLPRKLKKEFAADMNQVFGSAVEKNLSLLLRNESDFNQWTKAIHDAKQNEVDLVEAWKLFLRKQSK